MPKTTPAKINVLPAAHGIVWLKQSLTLMRAQPSRLLFLAVLVQLILGLIRVPLIGIFIIMATPAFSAGLLQAFRVVATGRRPTANILFIPLISGLKTGRLLVLGLLLFVVAIVIVSLILSGSASTIDPELLAKIEQGDVNAVKELDPAFVSRFVLALIVGVSISGTLSYLAIPLLWFHDHKLTTALVSGLKALFLNWRPFTLLALGMMALFIPVVVVLSVLFQLSGMSGALSLFLLGFMMLILMAFQLAIFGTQFCSFRDIYGLSSDDLESDQPESSDHQLLA